MSSPNGLNTFEERLAFGNEAEQLTVSLLAAIGLTEAIIQPPLADGADYGKKQFDVLIPFGDGYKTLEVKRRTEKFTSKADFRWGDPFVDNRSTYRKKEVKPIGYLMFNEDMNAAIFIPHNPSEWYERKVRRRWKLVCPSDHCLDLVDGLNLIKSVCSSSPTSELQSVSQPQIEELLLPYGSQRPNETDSLTKLPYREEIQLPLFTVPQT